MSAVWRREPAVTGQREKEAVPTSVGSKSRTLISVMLVNMEVSTGEKLVLLSGEVRRSHAALVTCPRSSVYTT